LEDFLPSATRVPLSLLPLQEAAGWIDEASSSRPAAAHAVVGPPDGATALMTFMEAVMMSGLARLLFVLSYILSKERSILR
jgi:hypothetical protein